MNDTFFLERLGIDVSVKPWLLLTEKNTRVQRTILLIVPREQSLNNSAYQNRYRFKTVKEKKHKTFKTRTFVSRV